MDGCALWPFLGLRIPFRAGILWNLSSSDNLKDRLARDTLEQLTDLVLVPLSGLGGSGVIQQNPSEAEIFYNSTGFLRYLLGAGPNPPTAGKVSGGGRATSGLYARAAGSPGLVSGVLLIPCMEAKPGQPRGRGITCPPHAGAQGWPWGSPLLTVMAPHSPRRNLSSASQQTRQKMRECHGLVDSMIHYVNSSLEVGKSEDKVSPGS